MSAGKSTIFTQTMNDCTKYLKNAAKVINYKLHIKNMKNYPDELAINIDNESKRTRRNSQYKTSALCMLYYIIHSIYYEKEPDYISFSIDSDTKPKKRKLSNKHKTENEKRETIQHYNTFDNVTYNYDMVRIIDMSMEKLVDFGINEFVKYARTFMLITLTIKRKLRNKKKSHKKKPETFNEDKSEDCTDSSDEDDDEDDSSEIFSEFANQSNQFLKEYNHYKIKDLKDLIKEPSVLMKFYQAWLLECDWEILLNNITNRMRNGYARGPTTKLLQYIINIMSKTLFAQHIRNLKMEKLENLLKCNQYNLAIQRLTDLAKNYKYSKYTIEDYTTQDDIQLYDVKMFNKFARNTENIYYHMSTNLLKLTLATHESKMRGIDISYTVIEYVHNHTKYLFDLINTSTISKEKLSEYSWKTRLDILREIPKASDHCIISIYPISIREIQFKKYPVGVNVHYYIRTNGLGIGTLFHNPSSCTAKNRTISQSQSKRFKRIQEEDLLIMEGQPLLKKQPVEEKIYNNNIQENVILENIFSNWMISKLNKNSNIPMQPTTQNNNMNLMNFNIPSPAPSPPPPIPSTSTTSPSSSPIANHEYGGLFSADVKHPLFDILE